MNDATIHWVAANLFAFLVIKRSQSRIATIVLITIDPSKVVMQLG